MGSFEDIMSKEFDVHYGEEEIHTVDSGVEAIEAVLTGNDVHAKERLLYYLDWYMDPYYKMDLTTIGESLKELLQRIVVTDNEIGVIEEAFHLLEVYTEGPYDILRKSIDKVPEALKPDVLSLINEDNG